MQGIQRTLQTEVLNTVKMKQYISIEDPRFHLK